MVNVQLRASRHQFDGEDQVESEQLLPRERRLLKRFSAGDLKSVKIKPEMEHWRIIQS